MLIIADAGDGEKAVDDVDEMLKDLSLKKKKKKSSKPKEGEDAEAPAVDGGEVDLSALKKKKKKKVPKVCRISIPYLRIFY